MKLLNIALAASALAQRVRNDGKIVRYSLTGNETPDDLMDMLVDVADGEDDELERALMEQMGVDRISTPAQVRKFRNLKIVVLWLQRGNQFGRYCYYGCYCLPEGSHDIASGGYGRALDPIDKACFEFKTCYKCLIEEHENKSIAVSSDGKCRGEEIGYSADLVEDENGNKSVECTNRAGECRRNICECDKKLAEEFARYEDIWDESLHANRGGFVRDDYCFRSSGGSPPVECCGGRFDFPFNQLRRENQCCDGPYAKELGSC